MHHYLLVIFIEVSLITMKAHMAISPIISQFSPKLLFTWSITFNLSYIGKNRNYYFLLLLSKKSHKY